MNAPVHAPANVNLSVLSGFRQHQLSDLKSASLMNRVDSKYLLPLTYLPEVLAQLQAHYSILTINNMQVFTYQTTYFDTPERDFYHAHHQGKRHRVKVRQRDYLDTNQSFLEVKHKTNKGRTEKHRFCCSDATQTGLNANTFLQSQIPLCPDELLPLQWGVYRRIALANEAQGERLTVDFTLTFRDLGSGNAIALPDLAIIEHKQQRLRACTPLSRLLGQMRSRPCRFSKYCMGSVLTNTHLKHNRFRPQLHALRNFSVCTL